jgi:FeS assembly SUF system regulator
MFKLNKLADYATVLLAIMAAEPARLYNGQELSAKSHLPAPTVAKLLKQLTRGGLLESLRGAHGGYRLTRTPARISVADIIRALEGPIAVTDCSVHGHGCDISRTCGSRTTFRLIDRAIRNALEAVSLADMAARPAREAVLHFHRTPPPPLA